MDAADAAGGKNSNAGHLRDNHGRCDGCGTVLPGGADEWQVTSGAFDHRLSGLGENGYFRLSKAGL